MEKITNNFGKPKELKKFRQASLAVGVLLMAFLQPTHDPTETKERRDTNGKNGDPTRSFIPGTELI